MKYNYYKIYHNKQKVPLIDDLFFAILKIQLIHLIYKSFFNKSSQKDKNTISMSEYSLQNMVNVVYIDEVVNLFDKRFSNSVPIDEVFYEEAELIKYMCNCFFATL